MKFGRRCQLKVEVDPVLASDGTRQGSNTLTIPQNIAIEFNIQRSFNSTSQTGSFRIIGLGEETRNRIQRDPYATGLILAIQFWAGYDGEPMALCFNGTVMSATSYATSGSPDFITEIVAYDGGFATANGFTSATIIAKTSVRDVLVSLARSLPAVSKTPLVGDFPQQILRGQALLGNTWSIIGQIVGAAGINLATIDNGQVKILNPDEAIDGDIPLIESDTGLLGTPRRTATALEFDMIFEPRLTLGQVIELKSATNKIYNNSYKVVAFNHHGTAPSTGDDPNAVVDMVVGGECTSNVSLFFGIGEFTIVNGFEPV